MKQLFRPTLVRRVFVSMLIACMLIWALFMSINLYANMGDAQTSEEVTGVSDYLADGLSEIDDDKAAAAFVRGAIGETKRDAYNWRNFRFIKYSLKDKSGRDVLTNTRQSGLGAETNKVTSIQIRGDRFLMTRRDTDRWSLEIALPLHDFWGILRDDWLGTMMTVLIAFPFVFIAVWSAIARGLGPLRLLSERIAARDSDDLTPVNVDPKFEELKPLVSALDSLLLQLRNKVSREHAFVQDAAHELRTPLAVISAQAHVMSMAGSTEERLDAERQMDQAIARAAHLIHQLLDLAKLDNQATEKAVMVDVVALVRQELAPRVPAAMQRRLDLSLETPDSLMFTIEPQAFLSVLHNLVDNALRYVQEGGRVLVEIRRADAGMVLSVADNGPGIPSDQAALVFERFHRVAQDKVPGSGLGLAIARKAADRLGGRLELSDGINGAGTQFLLTLPAP
ncbi:MAG: HAMP domain-containing sensor histidine kinase [Pseudomonadota bacterium]